MKIIAIYNNKGGEGKSTVTVGLAEFLARKKGRKVLVLDLDAQASSSGALLGRQAVSKAIDEGRTVADLVAQIRCRKRVPDNLEEFVVQRPASLSRGTRLEEIAVIPPDGEKMPDLEDQMDWRHELALLQRKLRPALTDYDLVLVDMPGNLKRASVISFGGLVMSDFVLVPVKPTDISLGGLPSTFMQVDRARDANGNGSPRIVGLLRNVTDRRFQQYRANFPQLLEMSERGELPPVFDNFWPHSSDLETATDGKRDYRTLKERFGTAYDKARKVAVELEQRCNGDIAAKPVSVTRRVWQLLGLG